ncbi:MAG TPA: radical SAM protein [Nevskiaceae bacterium]|nr:radical SAM protein [Nevskiaceae bacterium]
MKLALLITAHCNAGCTHCSTSCGPHRSEHLSREQIFRLIDEAAELNGSEKLRVLLSGGEPFLAFDLLLDVVRHARDKRAIVTCVTNAYWATSIEKARDLLRQLKAAGLRSFAISTSRFHQQFIKRQRVERALQASRDVGLRCTLKYVRVRDDSLDERGVRSWATSAGAHDVQDFPLLPHLRAGASAPESSYIRDAGVPTGTCPGAILTVREDGRAFTCCTPGAFTTLLQVGHATRDSLRDVNARFHVGGVQQILRRKGPGEFLEAIRARAQAHRLRSSYASVCDLCTHIAADPVLGAIATEVADAFEVRQVSALVESAITVTC